VGATQKEGPTQKVGPTQEVGPCRRTQSRRRARPQKGSRAHQRSTQQRPDKWRRGAPPLRLAALTDGWSRCGEPGELVVGPGGGGGWWGEREDVGEAKAVVGRSTRQGGWSVQAQQPRHPLCKKAGKAGPPWGYLAAILRLTVLSMGCLALLLLPGIFPKDTLLGAIDSEIPVHLLPGGPIPAPQVPRQHLPEQEADADVTQQAAGSVPNAGESGTENTDPGTRTSRRLWGGSAWAYWRDPQRTCGTSPGP